MNQTRYSILPGSNNAPILISRENLEITQSAGSQNITTTQEQTLVTMNLSADITITADITAPYIGDTLSFSFMGNSNWTVSWGFGLIAGPLQLVNVGPYNVATASFTYNGIFWMVTSVEPTTGGGGGSIGGSIDTPQVAFGNGLNTINGSNQFIWDNPNNTLSAGQQAYLYVQGNQGKIQLNTGTGGGTGGAGVEVDGNANTSKFGDFHGVNNSSLFTIDDSSKTATLQIDTALLNVYGTGAGTFEFRSGQSFIAANSAGQYSLYADLPNHITWVGDGNISYHQTSLKVNDENQLVSVFGNRIAQISNVTHGGFGLNDLTPSPPTDWTGTNSNLSFNVTMTNLDTQRINVVSFFGSFPIVGAFVQCGGTGATGTVIDTDGSTYLTLEGVTLLFNNTDLIDVVSPSWNGQCTGGEVAIADRYTLTNYGEGTDVLVPCTLSVTTTFQGCGAQFAALTGHTVGNTWDWNYGVVYGKMLDLDGYNRTYTLGNTDFQGNNTRITITDATGLMKLNALTTAIIGDTEYVNNGTFIRVEDGPQTITFSFNGSSYTFPAGDGANTQSIITDGAGNLSWGNAVASGTVAGAAGQVAYFTGAATAVSDPNFLWDAANLNFTVGDLTASGNGTVFSVNDTGGPPSIFSSIDGQILTTNTNGNQLLVIDTSNKFITMGTNGWSNQVTLNIDDTSQVVAITNARMLQTKASSSIPAAADLTLTEGNAFQITAGGGSIQRIDTTGWQEGSIVTLVFSGSVTVQHNNGVFSGTLKPLELAGSTNLSAVTNTVLQLLYIGSQWQEVSRKMP